MHRQIDTIAMSILGITANYGPDGEISQVTEIIEVPIFGEPQVKGLNNKTKRSTR